MGGGATAGSVSPWSGRVARAWKLAPAYSMMAPFLVLFAVFTLWPILNSLYLSFTQYAGTRAPVFTGLENYRALLADTRLRTALYNIGRYVLFTVSLNTVVGLTLAVVYQSQGRVNQLARTLFFMPSVTSGIAILTVWRFILRSDKYGLLNVVIYALTGRTVNFLGRPEYYMPVFVFISVWGSCGMTLIFFLAGLRSIPRELYEAAAVDGASPWHQFWRITLPLLRPVLLYVVCTGAIGAFQLFDMAYILGGGGNVLGGPLDAALTPVLYLYYLGFVRLRLGLASALAWVLFALIIIVTIVNLRLGRFAEQQ
ncbi:MAG: sugar ABC transporter permease [Anaerolineae bacterium]|nr:sugar ABC transporter permease [Anaerolineae bacterium]